MLKLQVLAAALLPICQGNGVVVNCDAVDGVQLSVETVRRGELEPLLAKPSSVASIDCRPALPLMCMDTRFCDVTRKEFWAKKVCMCVRALCARFE